MLKKIEVTTMSVSVWMYVSNVHVESIKIYKLNMTHK